MSISLISYSCLYLDIKSWSFFNRTCKHIHGICLIPTSSPHIIDMYRLPPSVLHMRPHEITLHRPFEMKDMTTLCDSSDIQLSLLTLSIKFSKYSFEQLYENIKKLRNLTTIDCEKYPYDTRNLITSLIHLKNCFFSLINSYDLSYFPLNLKGIGKIALSVNGEHDTEILQHWATLMKYTQLTRLSLSIGEFETEEFMKFQCSITFLELLVKGE